MPIRACVIFVLLTATPVWSQVDTNTTEPASPICDAHMLTPPQVSGQTYPTAPTSEARSNYLRYGVAFSTAYSDNVSGGASTNPVSDVSYSIGPTIALDETTSTLHAVLTYSPGFTFYQRISGRNEADHNVSIDFEDRLSPHVTFNARDHFLKSSNVLNQSDLAVSGGAQNPNLSVIAPLADVLSNSGNMGITYQFGPNGMIGASGTFTNLHYANPGEVTGLFDSNSQGGSFFYSFRVSKMHYVGATYQYQRLVSYPTEGQNETQTHAILFYYTLYPTSRFSISFFGGPQYSDTVQPPLPPFQIQLPPARAWTPAAGASLSWRGRLNSMAVSYSHVISGGGGLFGAALTDSASASIQQQFSRSWSGSLAGAYVQNDVLSSALFGGQNGHTVLGTVSLQKQFGGHISLQLGYTRLHQNYSNVPVLSLNPDTNREFVSVSYQFSRPLGR